MEKLLAVASNIPRTTLTDFVKTGFFSLSVLIGVASIVMIIYSGFLYATSSGDANNVTKAKNTLMYAIIGLVVASLAAAIINFALGGLGL
jgi:hypothetical protein